MKNLKIVKTGRRLAFLFLMSCIASNLVCTAANQSPPLCLTPAQAVAYALKADYQIKSDANSLEKAKLAVKKTTLDNLPQATVEGQYQYQTSDNTYPSGYQIVIKQTLPTYANLYGQKLDSSTVAAMWDQLITEATLQIDQADVIYNTYSDYLNVLKLQQMVKQEEEAVTMYKQSNTAALLQLKLGKITKPDQLKIENYLNQAEYNLTKDRSDLEIALETLANQTGLQDLSQYRLEEMEWDAQSAAGTLSQELAALQNQALARRLELKKLDLSIKKALRTWAQNKNNEFPALSFNYNNKATTQSYNLGYNFLSGDFSWQAAQSGSSGLDSSSGSSSSGYFLNSGNKSYFTLKLSWTLDFGATANTTQQSKYSLENAKLDWEKEQQTIRLEVKQAWADYRMAVKQHELNQKALIYYAKDVEIKLLQAKLGTLKAADLAEAQQDALEARITAVKSSYDQILAYHKLQKATGNLYLFASQPKTGGTQR